MANFSTCNTVLQDFADWLGEHGRHDICDLLKSNDPPKGGFSDGLVEKDSVGQSLRAWIDAATPEERNKLLAAIYPECAFKPLQLIVEPKAETVHLFAYEPNTLDLSPEQPVFDWGDGTPPSQSPHTYDLAAKQRFTITEVSGASGKSIRTDSDPQTVTGDSIPGNDNLSVVEIVSFGAVQNIRVGSMYLTTVPTQIPPTLTGFDWMFAHAQLFNQDISGWDTRNVTSFEATFLHTDAFNQPIGSWNTSNVTTMLRMFQDSASFNQDLNGWDTSKVWNMASMFYMADNFNGNIASWNTGNVISMWNMFQSAPKFNGQIGSWDTSNVDDMKGMFRFATVFNGDISGWDTSKVTDFWNMFQHATAFNSDISSWDTSSAVKTNGMFSEAVSFNQDISGWDVSNVTDMASMFEKATSFNQDLSSWDVANVTLHVAFSAGATSWTLPKPNF